MLILEEKFKWHLEAFSSENNCTVKNIYSTNIFTNIFTAL